jgi:pimeloyl-ACP methyl ester carboxylesterase
LIGHSIGGKIASIYTREYPQNIDAIIFINSSSKRMPDKDLEKHIITRKIAITEGMYALAEWIRDETEEARSAFKDQSKWNYFKEIFTKTSVEDFIAATKALYTMPENITQDLDIANHKLFGIVGSKDEVFVRLTNEMKREIPGFKLKIIEGCDHWLIVENPTMLDKALEEFLDDIYSTGNLHKDLN